MSDRPMRLEQAVIQPPPRRSPKGLPFELFTLEEAAELLHCTPKWLERFLVEKGLEIKLAGRRKVVSRRTLDTAIAHMRATRVSEAALNEEVAAVNAAHDEAEAAGIPTQRRGYVYFIEVMGKVKIGFAVDVAVRLQIMQSGCPERYTLLHVVRGSLADEKAFHRRFRHLHYFNEWFRLEGDLAKYLERGRK